MQQDKDEEQMAIMQDHLEEKKLLCEKLRELEQESTAIEQNDYIENGNSNEISIKNYWEVEMDEQQQFTIEEPSFTISSPKRRNEDLGSGRKMFDILTP